MAPLFGRVALALILSGAVSASASAQPASMRGAVRPTAAASVRPHRAVGYFPTTDVPDAAAMLGPPPEPGSGTADGDLATFHATRALQGSPRWALATRDAALAPDAVMQDFSCALGVQLTAANAPVLRRMLARLLADAGAVQGAAKQVFKRPRPFVDHQGAICVPKDASLVGSYSYPSGHSTFIWTAALSLADAAPDRAAEILARARVFAESRVVCGVHYESDVQAGRVSGALTFSALQAEPEFQRDLRAVRGELAALRSSGGSPPDAPECRIEADAVAHPVW